MNQVVVVTGASHGIGAAAAVWLGSFGASVVAVGRDTAALADIADQVELAGGHVLTVAGDLTAPDQATELASAAISTFGRIDAVINNAAVLGEVMHMSQAPLEMWRQVYEVNVFAVLSCIKATVPALRAGGGRLVNLTSAVATRPSESLGAYASSKAAISHLTATLAVEEPQVTVVGYSPGPTTTALMTTVLRSAPWAMSAAAVSHYQQLEASGMVDLQMTARKLALLALRAPRDWTGRIVDHTSREIDALGA